jgi:hypothetical protein
MEIYDSDKRGKRLVALFEDGDYTYFGLEGGTTYIDVGNREMRKNYLARHRPNEHWNDYKSAGALSRWILWGASTNIHKNIASYKKRFNLNNS